MEARKYIIMLEQYVDISDFEKMLRTSFGIKDLIVDKDYGMFIVELDKISTLIELQRFPGVQSVEEELNQYTPGE